MSHLADILASKRVELVELDDATRSPVARKAIDVVGALRRTGPMHLIAEVKMRSPSAGPLSSALSAHARAVAYATGGASMVSVLVDGPFFGGKLDRFRGSSPRPRCRRPAGPAARQGVRDRRAPD